MSRQIIGLCAAAALLAGSHAVHALMIVPGDSGAGDPAGPDALSSVTYATETLRSDEMIPDTEYYGIRQTLVVSGAPGITAVAGDTFLVNFELDGMVFASDAELFLANATTSFADTFDLVSGGGIGDDSAIFRLSAGGSVMAGQFLALRAKYAIPEGGSGTITRTVRNAALEGLGDFASTMTETASGIIRVAPALREDLMPNDLTATVASGFNTFASAGTVMDTLSVSYHTGYLGTYKLMFEGHRRADIVAGTAVNAATHILDVSPPNEANPFGASNFSLEGDFSFADAVWLGDSPECDAYDESTDNLLILDDDGVAESVSTPTMIADTPAGVSVVAHFCMALRVDNEDRRIPVTAPYMVVPSYQGITTGAAIGPKAMGGMLGAIDRDGTTVRLPYLTTNEKFRQRIRVVNRGGAAVPYEMDFHGEDDVAGDDATGTFEQGITVFNLGDGMLVEPGNGRSTSATLTVEIAPSAIDVVSVLVNRELGTTDTVVYQPE